MTWHVGLVKFIHFTRNKRHCILVFPSKLSEAKREEAEVQKAMEELKRKATPEWGRFDHFQVTLNMVNVCKKQQTWGGLLILRPTQIVSCD